MGCLTQFAKVFGTDALCINYLYTYNSSLALLNS